MAPEAFARAALLIGEGGLARLAGARVAVFGVGGVGSYTVEALARAGVGGLLLVDDDTIAPSNLNRQLHAAHSTLGQPKVEVMARRVADINPAATVECLPAFCLPDNVDQLLTGPLDYIVDAVDTVSAKVALVQAAGARGIPIISAMGTGNKLDPTRFQVADLYETSVCPLCRVMRRELRRRGVPALRVVYSREEPLSPPPASQEDSARHPKRQIPGSISFVPPVAGMILAGEVVRDLLGIPRRSNGKK